MISTKTLTSSIAATALVATIGLAYAQSAPDSTGTIGSSDTSQMQSTPADTTTAPTYDATPATTDSSTAPADSSLSSEPAPQADRN